MSFAQLNLHEAIHKALTHCGYTKPTPVQSRSIPDILNGHDVAVSAQTGSGKTAAFVIPALQQLANQARSKKTRILILTPTRELATQITKAANTYGKFLKFNIVNLVGGMPYHQQIKDLARGADIIVATPGRLLDHIEQKRVDLSHVEMLILDEADRMLDMGFIDDVQYIAKLTPGARQTLLFSATLDNRLMNVTRHLLKNPIRIDLSNEKIAAPQIKQEFYKTQSPQQKARLLKHFLNDENIFKAIIFSATKVNADKLATQLRDDGFAAAALHGDLRQNVRNRTLEQLRRGKIQFLVATDVAARGIDIGDITHVINYDLPRFCEDYVHRIGRTGRAGKNGIAISFVLPSDIKHVQRIERYIGQRLKLNTITIANDATATVKLTDHTDEKTERQHDDNDYREQRPRKKFSDRKYHDKQNNRGDRRKSAKRQHDDDYREQRPRKKFSDKKYPDKQDDRSNRRKPAERQQDDHDFREQRPRKKFSDRKYHDKQDDRGDRRKTTERQHDDHDYREQRPRKKFSDKKYPDKQDDHGNKKSAKRQHDDDYREQRPRKKFSDKKYPDKQDDHGNKKTSWKKRNAAKNHADNQASHSSHTPKKKKFDYRKKD